MPKTKISEFSATPANNTDIDSINISEGCAPSGINDAIRELMAQLKDFQTGAVGDSFNGPVGTSTAAAGAFTTLSASSTATLNTLVSSGATLTGGSINGMAIGGTTAAAGAFTTLAASGAVTLSGGTANGVAYLNGSKVVTSGSALTFDGTDFSATGTTTVNSANSTQVALVVKGETGNGIRQRFIGQASSGQYNWQIGASITAAGSFAIIPSTAVDGTTFSTAAYSITGTGTSIWAVGGSEQMRLTSTGLGIGTSSPLDELDVVSANATYRNRIRNSGANEATLLFQNSSTGTATNDGLFLGILGGMDAYLWNYENNPIIFGTNNTERMRLDSSGNLGLGVTPSAWDTYKAIQISAQGSLSSTSTAFNMGTNVYYGSGGYTYIANGEATLYQQNVGGHNWRTAASGTAGAAVTFTQAMTLDASGNLGVGTTSPSTYGRIVSSGGTISLVTDTASQRRLSFYSTSNGTSENAYIQVQNDGSTTNTGQILFATKNSGGTLAERARISAEGDLLVGATSSNYAANGVGLRSNAYSYFTATSNAPLLLNRKGTTGSLVSINYEDSGVGSISTDGSSTSYNTTSDQRLKENILDADSASSLIDSLQVRKFDWKKDNAHQRYGFVAQELVTVAPEAVYQPNDPEEMMAVDYSKLVPMLVKEIQSLRKRLADAGI
jgi:hypothetical protein